MHDNCFEAVEQLYFYLDGELTYERRVVIAQHLADCPPCGDAFDFESELRIVIAQKCRERVPEGLRARVYEALRRLDQPSPRPGEAAE
jgi:mycothiol system anti-sigma-R factor